MKDEIKIVSIGQGDPDLLNIVTINSLRKAEQLILRTGNHPLTAWLESNKIAYQTLDELYGDAEDFDQLAQLIADLIRGLRTRVYEYQHSVPKAAQNANAVQELISRMEALSENADQLMLFINEGIEELAKINRQLFEL